MDNLPNDIIFDIFTHLELNDSLSFALVCNGFHNIFEVNSLWKYYFEMIYNDEVDGYDITKEYKDDYHNVFKWLPLKKDLQLNIKYNEIDTINHILKMRKKITNIPKAIKYCINLQQLSLNRNQIQSIPKEIS